MTTLTSDDIKFTDYTNHISFRDYDTYPCDRCGALFNETALKFPDPTLFCLPCIEILIKKVKEIVSQKVFENRTKLGGSNGFARGNE